jgi:hypothetical protein
MAEILVELLLWIIVIIFADKISNFFWGILFYGLYFVFEPRNFFKDLFRKIFPENPKLTFSESFTRKHYRKN